MIREGRRAFFIARIQLMTIRVNSRKRMRIRTPASLWLANQILVYAAALVLS